MGASSLANLDLAVSIDTRVDYAPVGCFSIVSSGLRVFVQVLCHGSAGPRWVRFCWRDPLSSIGCHVISRATVHAAPLQFEGI